MNEHRGHILILEQNPGTGRVARNLLSRDRFRTTVFDGRTGNQQGSISDYDLVLLEHQQRKQGACLKILQKLREASPVPIVVLSDEPNSTARIEALEKGADDVLSRPFLGRELLARVNALLRRSRLSSQCCQQSRFRINRDNHQVVLRGKVIDLTQREFDILEVLAAEPGRNFNPDGTSPRTK